MIGNESTFMAVLLLSMTNKYLSLIGKKKKKKNRSSLRFEVYVKRV